VRRKKNPDSSFDAARVKRAAGNDVTGFIRSLTLASLLALAWPIPAAWAAGDAAADERIAFDIPRQRADSALVEFAAQADVTFIFPFEEARRNTANRLQGTYTRDEAIALLLRGTGLRARFDEHGALAVHSTNKSETDGDGMATNNTTKGLAGIAATIVGLFTSAGARAQDGAGENGIAPSLEKLEEVVVTATKRAQSVQDIPMSLAVVSSMDIERRGAIGMEDYLRSVPGVNQMDAGGRDNAIVIRGISTSLEFQNSRGNVTVASYFDEAPITGAAGHGAGGIDVRPVDLERIEVLRGPQGTTFGNSSLGGAMRLIPAKPNLTDFSGKVTGSYSDTSGAGSGNSMVQGVLNVPIFADKIAVRAVGYRYEDSGFYRNVAGTDAATLATAASLGLADFVRGFVQDDVGQMRTTGGRLAALWQATDKLSVSANILSQDIEQDGRPVSSIGRFEQARFPLNPLDRVRGERGEVADTRMDLATLVLNYDLGWSAFTSALSWVEGGSEWSQSFDHSSVELASSKQTSDFNSFTVETRLASSFEGPFQFLAGLYSEDVENDYLQEYHWPGDPARNPFRTDPQLVSDQFHELDQRALFGELSYELTEQLKATVGGRYFRFERDGSVLTEGGVVRVPVGTGVPSRPRVKDDGSTYKASLSYEPTSNAMFYTSWAQGFRLGPPDGPGGANLLCDANGDGIIDGTSVTLESARHVESDYLDNYEIGGKLSFLDRRLVVDASVYRIDWTGLPFTVRPGGGTCTYTANAGEAISQGLDLQASVFAFDGFRIDVGMGYTRAELTKDVPEQGFEDGDRLPGSPKWNGNLSAQYDFAFASYPTFVRLDSFYTDDFYGDLLESPGTRAGDYIKLDARVGLAVKQLSVELFARNLTNEDAYTWRGQAGPASGITKPFFGYQLRPRTIGIQLGYSFE
jgi:iron complex outermembrane recepter protein